MGLFDRLLGRLASGGRSGSDTRQCQFCGARKRWAPVKRGSITFATPQEIQGIILHCNDCGKFTCYSCAAAAGTSVVVGGEEMGTQPGCPGCGGNGVSQPQI